MDKTGGYSCLLCPTGQTSDSGASDVLDCYDITTTTSTTTTTTTTTAQCLSGHFVNDLTTCTCGFVYFICDVKNP